MFYIAYIRLIVKFVLRLLTKEKIDVFINLMFYEILMIDLLTPGTEALIRRT